MTVTEWYLWVGSALVVLGLGPTLLGADRIRRLVALNVTSSGTLVILLAVAGRTDPPDPVLHALALTSIVITVAMTGFGIVLTRRIDELDEEDEEDEEGGGR